MGRRGIIESMPGDFLRVLGKVLLFTGAGMAAAFAFGGTGLALGSVLGVMGTISGGAACLVAAMALHRRSLEACYSEKIGAGDVDSVSVELPMKAMEPTRAASVAEEDVAVKRFVEQLEAERLNSLAANYSR
jgi:hypothetical protein